MLVQKLPAILWLILAMIGFGLQLGDLIEVVADQRWLRRMGFNGRLRILARGHVRRSGIRVGCMAINALIGLAVITVPVASDNPPRTSLQIAAAFIVGLGLSAVEWLLVISTYFDRRDRKAITRELVTPILQQQQYDEQRNSHSDTAEALGLPEEKP